MSWSCSTTAEGVMAVHEEATDGHDDGEVARNSLRAVHEEAAD